MLNYKVVDLVEYYNFDADLSPFDIVNHHRYNPRTYIGYWEL